MKRFSGSVFSKSDWRMVLMRVWFGSALQLIWDGALFAHYTEVIPLLLVIIILHQASVSTPQSLLAVLPTTSSYPYIVADAIIWHIFHPHIEKLS